MVLFILIGIVTVILALSLYTYFECFHSPANRSDDPYSRIKGAQYDAVSDNMYRITRIMDNTPHETVTVTSFDGLTLSGRYYHTKDSAPLQILFHGYRSMALRDCAGGFILSKKMGFNVLAVDQRAHAKSGGRVITFGICERRDCVSWAEYAKKRFGSEIPIILSGLSMGAATVLMASELELPKNVVGIMADCPYSSPRAIIRKVCRDRRIPEKLAYPFIRIGARLFGGFSLEECSAVEAVKHCKLPILLIHGEDDRFVPCDMSRKIYTACKEKAQLHTFPDAAHGLCYMTDPLRYEEVTTRFLWDIPALKQHMAQSEYVQKELSGEPIDY